MRNLKTKILKLSLGILIASSGAMTQIHAEEVASNVATTAIGDSFVADTYFEYKITSDTEVELKYYDVNKAAPSAVVIPDTVTNDGKTYQVTSIGESAFTTGSIAIRDPYTLTIGNNVKVIKDNAFELSAVSGELIIPDSVTTIGDKAFSTSQTFSNVGITKLTLSKNLTSIGKKAFFMNRITSVEIPDATTYLGEEAFAKNYLQSVKVGNGITVIPASVFEVNKITQFQLGENITKIEHDAFSGNQLDSIDLSKYTKLKVLGARSFAGNAATSILLPEGIEYLGYSFMATNYLDEIEIPASVTYLGAGTFSDVVTTVHFKGDGKNLKAGGIDSMLDPSYPAADYEQVLFPDSTQTFYVPTVESVETYKQLFNSNIIDSKPLGVQIPNEDSVLKIKTNYFGYAKDTPLKMTKKLGGNAQIAAINDMTAFAKWNTDKEDWDNILEGTGESVKPVQWYKDGKALSGKTSGILDIDNIKEEDAGKYYAVANGVTLASITLEIEDAEKLTADDFSLTVEEAKNLTEDQAKTLSNVKAWNADTNANTAISKVDISEVKAEQGVYDVTFTTVKGKSITVKAVVGKTIAYYSVDGDDVTMTLKELKTQTSNGTLEEYIIEESNAKGTKRDINGVYDVPVHADVKALEGLKAGESTQITVNADTTSSTTTRATQEVVETSKQINVKIVDEEKKASISAGDENKLMLATITMLASVIIVAFIIKNKKNRMID